MPGGKRPGAGRPRSPQHEHTKIASFSLDQNTITKLDAYAHASGRTKSRIVDQAIQGFLAARQQPGTAVEVDNKPQKQ
jgi:predicted DNA-binding protein